MRSSQIFYVILVVLLTSNYAVTQEFEWTTLSPPLSGRYDDMHFISPDMGWAVNSTGQIWKTSDAGETWVQQAQLGGYIRSIEFADSLNGWAGTLGGEIPILYRTTDGGQSWSPVQGLPTFSPRRICGITAPTDSVIYAGGAFDGPARILKSVDKGNSWQAIDMRQHAGTLIDVHFFTPDSGIAVGGAPAAQQIDLAEIRAVIMTTADGGQSWQVRYSGSSDGQWGWKIFFVTRNTGFVSLESNGFATLAKTTDGGLTWSPKSVPNNARLQGIGFLTPDLGWVGGWGSTASTTDGGDTWEIGKIGTQFAPDHLNRFIAFGDSLVYASGKTVFKYSQGNVTSVASHGQVELPKSIFLLQNHPNPFNPSTTISYTLPRNSGDVRVRVYNSLGQSIRTVFAGAQPAGSHSVVWDGKNDAGQSVASDIYIYRVDAGGRAESRTMTLLK